MDGNILVQKCIFIEIDIAIDVYEAKQSFYI
jgi:hypothetical protein